jgi:RNA polymerase sigma factor (sigma-70 family)
MASAHLDIVLRHIRKVVGGAPGKEPTDRELLERFSTRREEAVFEALVRRHGPLVLGVCRRVLGREHDAEDAFQATFLVLARKAGSIRKRASLGSWLYGVAYRLALKAKASAARRRAHERRYGERARAEPESDRAGWELRPVLDEELRRLPERYRAPLVLCYLEGKTNVEAARVLGWPPGSLSKRLARARELLRGRLIRRGVTLSTVLSAGGLSEAPVPAALAVATVQGALQFTMGPAAGAVISAQVVTLAEGVLKAMFVTKLKVAAALVVALGVLAVGAGFVARQPPAAEPAQEQQADASQTAPAKDQPQREKSLLSGTVVGATGEPAAGATVWLVGGRYDEDLKLIAKVTTDGQGRFAFPGLTQEKLFQREQRLPSLIARDPQGRLGWLSQFRRENLSEQPIRIEVADVNDVHGRVVDGSGAAIAGARLTPLYFEPSRSRTRNTDFVEVFPELAKQYEAETAADGSFILRGLPARGQVTATVTASGFGFPRIAWEYAQPVTIRLDRAGSVRGALMGATTPRPPAGVKLQIRLQSDRAEGENAGYRLHYWKDTRTKDDGTFEFDGLPPGKYTITPRIEPPGPVYAEPTAPFEVKPGATVSGLAIPLRPAITVRGRVVDKESGAGIKGVEVRVANISEVGYLENMVPATTDAEGWYSAYMKPGRTTVLVQRTPDGYVVPLNTESSLTKVEATKDIEFPAIPVDRAARVTGLVVDEAGKPVPGAKVHLALPPRTNQVGEVPAPISDAEGKFTLGRLDPQDNLPLRARTDRVVTDGAVVVVPGELKGPVRLVVSEKEAFRLRGTVVDQAGRPVKGAVVRLLWNYRYVSKRSQLSGSGAWLQKITTDADGRFETHALWPGDRYRVEVSADGYAKTESVAVEGRRGQTHDLSRITLFRTGGFVAGKVVDTAGRPLAGVRVFNAGEAPWPVHSVTDESGRFRLDDLYAGPVYVFAQKAGYRFTAARVSSDTTEVTITLHNTGEAVPRIDGGNKGVSFVEQQKTARRLLERLWALPAAREGASSRILQAMARLDPGQALRWSAQAGGRYDHTVRVTAAEHLADTDLDEALALLAPVKGDRAFTALKSLAERYISSDPAKALQLTEEAVVRARALEQPHRSWSLTQAASLVLRLGQVEAGRKLLDEAAEMAAKLGTERLQGYARGLVAEALAPYDFKRAMGLLEPITNRAELERYTGKVAIAVAPHDLDKALEIVGKFEKRTSQPDLIRMAIAHRLASTRPAKAISIVEGMDSYAAPKMKAEAFGWLAVALAPHDKSLAYSLIDRSLAMYLDRPETVRGWSNYGGRSVMAARVASQALEIGYPHMESVVARVLAMRATGQEDSPARVAESHVATAMVLALVDPGTARQMLEAVEPRSSLIGTAYSSIGRPHWFQAWALADPARAALLFEKELAALKDKPGADLSGSGVLEMVELLTIPPRDRAYHLLRRSGSFWFPGEE